MTVPPGGPTCRHCCAGLATAAARARATAPNHFEFIRMHSPKGGKSPQGWSVGEVRETRACPKGQIRGSLVTVLVLLSRHCGKMQLSFLRSVLFSREGLILPAEARLSVLPSQGMLA